MQFKLDKPLAFTEIGQKTNNEDRISPDVERLTPNIRCFVLCDGMGGHEQGEVAAEIVATTLRPALLDSRTDPDIITRQRFNAALSKAYDALDEKMTFTTELRPGTTMTCLYMAANGVLAAHIGDSRIYQVRPGKGVVFRTSDHSLVNELVKIGELTEEEAKTFSRRNVITRAMQPKLDIRYKADIELLTDVQAGDYFFMCSDGVLENIDDETLVDILSAGGRDENKFNTIREKCLGKTRDNYTCILIPVVSVSGEPLPTPEPKSVQAAPLPKSGIAERSAVKPSVNKFQSDEAVKSKESQMNDAIEKRSRLRRYFFIVLIIAVVALAALYFIDYLQDNYDEIPQNQVEQEEVREFEEEQELHLRPETKAVEVDATDETVATSDEAVTTIDETES